MHEELMFLKAARQRAMTSSGVSCPDPFWKLYKHSARHRCSSMMSARVSAASVLLPLMCELRVRGPLTGSATAMMDDEVVMQAVMRGTPSCCAGNF